MFYRLAKGSSVPMTISSCIDGSDRHCKSIKPTYRRVVKQHTKHTGIVDALHPQTTTFGQMTTLNGVGMVVLSTGKGVIGLAC